VKIFLAMLIAVVGAVLVALAGPIPGAGENRIFLFASPNTQASLSDQDAQARLHSFEQLNATAVADRAACSLTSDVRIGDALGIYDRSSENSFLMETDLKRKQSEYLAALLGLYSHQEFVLLFLEESGRSDRLVIIQTPQSLEAVIAALRKRKITPVTVRTEKDRNEIWFVDMGNKRAGDLNLLASDVNGRASVTVGVAEMLGRDDRAMAIEAWRQQISAFEQQNGRRLSRQLTSKAWRNATAVHTCSKEISVP